MTHVISSLEAALVSLGDGRAWLWKHPVIDRSRWIAKHQFAAARRSTCKMLFVAKSSLELGTYEATVILEEPLSAVTDQYVGSRNSISQNASVIIDANVDWPSSALRVCRCHYQLLSSFSASLTAEKSNM